jgi:pimeloyl-ACP methyl ester carboxylesterase
MGTIDDVGAAASASPDEPRPQRVPVADGVELAVTTWKAETDSGPSPFVLLHGIASTVVGWDGVAGRLVATGRTVYTVDFRGHGQSDRPDEGYDLATFASDLIAVVDGLGLAPPILAGHSLGANVILEAVARRPGIAAGVCLVEGGLVDARDQFRSFDECLASLALPPVSGLPLARLQGYLRQSHPAWSDLRLSAAIAAFDVHADGTVSWRLTGARYEQLLRDLWAARVASRWPAIRVPTLAVAADTGDESWTTAKRAAEAEMRRAIPGVRIEWLTADHDVHTDRPDRIADLLLEAFAGL